MTAYVVRATLGHNVTPSLRYWHADTGRWGDYDAATRYDHTPTVTRRIVDALGNHSHTVNVSVAQAYGVDVDGYPYTDSSIGPVRLTRCCAAATSVNDGPLYCKSCYAEVDWAYDGPARLAPPPPPTEPAATTEPDTMTTNETPASAGTATPMICPECQEQVRAIPPHEWLLSGWKPRPAYSHHDGTPLCNEYGPDGVQPADAIPAPETPIDD